MKLLTSETIAAKIPTAVCLGLIGLPQLGHASALRETGWSPAGQAIRYCVAMLPHFHYMRISRVARVLSNTLGLNGPSHSFISRWSGCLRLEIASTKS